MSRITSFVICLALTALIFIMSACAEETKTEEIKTEVPKETILRLPACAKLINVSWKNDNLWYLTRPLRTKETTETYTFKKELGFSIPTLDEVPVTIIESCPNPPKPNN